MTLAAVHSYLVLHSDHHRRQLTLANVVATASGGTPPTSGYTARVNWGDATPLGTTTIAPGTTGSPATVLGGHPYLKAGEYTIAVSVDDGVTSTVARTTVHVTGLGIIGTPSAGPTQIRPAPGGLRQRQYLKTARSHTQRVRPRRASP